MDERLPAPEEIGLPFDVELPPARKLKAGQLSCMYEAGNLRYIHLGDTEIALLIYSAVRDENWNTLPVDISNEKIAEYPDGFDIQYDAAYRSAGMDFSAAITIIGRADNSVEFSMKGKALCDFKMNRIGLCILHPLSYGGKRAHITKPDGSVYSSDFPKMISPHQAFLSIHKMAVTLQKGIDAQFVFEGDIFETEDQRNWSDSSYKTYSTPVALPTPVLIKRGDKVEQRITLGVEVSNQNEAVKEADMLIEEKIAFPRLGYSRVNGQPKLTREHYELFRQIPFDHYRVELFLDDLSWPEDLAQAAEEARQLEASLELAVSFSNNTDQQLPELIKYLKIASPLVSSILVLHNNGKATPVDLLEKVYNGIKKEYPFVKIGYGSIGHFVDINRNRPGGNAYDFVSFSLTPQAHLKDTLTILDNLRGLPDTIATVRAEIGDTEVYISPVIFKGRNGHRALDYETSVSAADARQYSSLAAFWTLICLQNISASGHITFYQLFGKAGLIDGAAHSAFFEALRKIRKFDPVNIIRRYKNEQLLLDAFVVENASGRRMIIKLEH